MWNLGEGLRGGGGGGDVLATVVDDCCASLVGLFGVVSLFVFRLEAGVCVQFMYMGICIYDK